MKLLTTWIIRRGPVVLQRMVVSDIDEGMFFVKTPLWQLIILRGGGGYIETF